jgi:pyruvate formate lyase activating enzyme
MSFPIKGFIETSFVDWPGKIASVIFLPQCNFRCPYCHNYDLVLNPDQCPTVPVQHILTRLRHYGRWIDGVCITGGEPTLFPDLRQLIETLRNEQLLIKLDTNGSRPQVLKRLLQDGLLDHVSMDVKSPLDPESYSRCSGVPVTIEHLQESVDLLQAHAPSYEFRVTVVPTLLTRNHLVQLAHELTGAAKLTLQHFSPLHTLDPQCKKITPYTDGEMSSMQDEVNQIISQSSMPLKHAV